MPKFDRVEPGKAIEDLSKAKIAIVTSGGIVPVGNPDHIESSNATKFGWYTMEGMDRMSKDDYMTIHGGYDRQFVLENPQVIKTPVVRNGKQSTLGYQPNIWKTWK